MNNLGVGIFAENLMELYEHYKRAFDATIISTANGSQGELIHLEIGFMGNNIWVQPSRPRGITKKDNPTILGLSFPDKESLLKAYNVLKEDCVADDGLKELPWNPLQGILTDKFGVTWCIGL